MKSSRSLAIVLAMLYIISICSLSSCGDEKDPVITDTTGTDAPASETEPLETEPVIDDEPVPDGCIGIASAEELAKIGNDKKYPLSGDYVIIADIDLSSIDNWRPIGGVNHDNGYIGTDIFNGTINGRGHVISGLTIDASGSGTSQYGLFGSVSGKSTTSPCTIENIIIRGANIQVKAGGMTCAGVITGQASGSVEIKNITILSSSVYVNASGGEALGVGGLIGQCRTSDSRRSNRDIFITDVFCDAKVTVENNANADYCSGIIGRIRGSDLGELSRVIYYSKASYNGSQGFAITTGDSSVVKKNDIYFLNTAGQKYNNIGKSVSYKDLAAGSIDLGDGWTFISGLTLIPNSAYESKSFSVLDMMSITFAKNESANKVKSSFTLPTELGGSPVAWTSSDDKYISIDGKNAVVTKPESGFVSVKLTAECLGDKKTFDIVVKSDVMPSFTSTTARPGDTVTAVGYGDASEFTWTITDMKKGKSKTATTDTPELTIPDDTDEALITLTVFGYDDISVYCSSIPVIYITSDVAYSSLSKSGYSDATLITQSVNDNESNLYSGHIGIKLRGNSTAGREKRPFKIKLDTSTNILTTGEGPNKHWTLLANDIDHTLLRNKLLYDFSGAIGTEFYMHSQNVVLIYNGEYYGVYQLCEHIRIGKSRVNIFDWMEFTEDFAETVTNSLLDSGELAYSKSAAFEKGFKEAFEKSYTWLDTGEIKYDGKTYKFSDYGFTMPEPDGGWLLEMDFYHKNAGNVALVQTAYIQPLYFNSPSGELALSSFKSTALYKNAVKYIQSFEYALHSDDFVYRDADTHYQPISDNHNTKYKEVAYSDPEHDGLHYSEMFDMDNLVENFIFCEVAMNWDSMKNSFFVYKDIGKLAKIGPQWDFDWAWGNTSMYGTNTWYPKSWHTTEQAFMHEQYYQTVQWNTQLIRDPFFLTRAYEMYHELRDTVIVDYFGDGGILDKSAAAVRNAALANDHKWKYTYNYNREEFDDSIDTMKEFLSIRFGWLDKQFETPETLANSLKAYRYSTRIDIVSVDVGGTETTVTVEVNEAGKEAGIEKIIFQINGTDFRTVDVKNGKAVLTVKNTELDASHLNCIEAKSADADGNYIVRSVYSKSGNYNIIDSDFVSFDIK